jgi:NADPH:quinone reductase-like Zn-dependent oxidoreductase
MPVRGTDFAGTIEAIGRGVTGWQSGDPVFGEAAGTLAEHVVANVQHLAGIPDGVTLTTLGEDPQRCSSKFPTLWRG